MDQRARRKRSINNDDLKEDGGGEGGMQMGGEATSPGGQNGQNGQNGSRQRTTVPAQTRLSVQQQPMKADGTIHEAAGTWQYTIDSPQGGNGTLVLKKTEGEYTGTIRGERMPQDVALTDVKVNGNEVSFSYPVSFGGNTNTVRVKAVLGKDAMQGTMSIGEMRTLNLSAKKVD